MKRAQITLNPLWGQHTAQQGEQADSVLSPDLRMSVTDFEIIWEKLSSL